MRTLWEINASGKIHLHRVRGPGDWGLGMGGARGLGAGNRGLGAGNRWG